MPLYSLKSDNGDDNQQYDSKNNKNWNDKPRVAPLDMYIDLARSRLRINILRVEFAVRVQLLVRVKTNSDIMFCHLAFASRSSQFGCNVNLLGRKFL